MPKSNRNIIDYAVLYPLLAGMLFGCVLYLGLCADNPDILSSDYFKLFDVNNMSLIHIVDESRINNSIIYSRIIQIILFVLLSYTISFYYSSIIYNIIFGYVYGFTYSMLFVQYGLKGIFLTVALTLPHFLIYIICIILFGRWICTNCNNIYKLSLLIKIFVIILLLSFAIYWEINFQKNFQKIFTNI